MSKKYYDDKLVTVVYEDCTKERTYLLSKEYIDSGVVWTVSGSKCLTMGEGGVVAVLEDE